MEQIEKKELKVDAGASKSVGSWRMVVLVLAVLLCAAGALTTIFGIAEGDETWVVGIALLASSIPFFITSALLRGLVAIVEASEYYKALVWKDYAVRDL